MTAPDFKCHGCGHTEETMPLSLLDGRLVGPIATLRVRSTRGEFGQRMVLLTCPNCGLVSLYDADWVQAQLDR